VAGLQSDEGRMVIDSAVWAQYTNVTDTQTDRHVAIESAALHWVAKHWEDKKVMRAKQAENFVATMVSNCLLGLGGTACSMPAHCPSLEAVACFPRQ